MYKLPLALDDRQKEYKLLKKKLTRFVDVNWTTYNFNTLKKYYIKLDDFIMQASNYHITDLRPLRRERAKIAHRLITNSQFEFGV